MGPQGSSPLSLSLLIVDPEGTARQWPLRPGPVKVGRGQANDLIIVGRGVSRLHAVLTLEGEKIHVEDQDSTYGTKINGRQMRKADVGVGDHIDIGVFRLVVVPAAERIEDPFGAGLGLRPPTTEDGSPRSKWDEPTVGLLTTAELELGSSVVRGPGRYSTARFSSEETSGVRRLLEAGEASDPYLGVRFVAGRDEALEPLGAGSPEPPMASRVEGLVRALAQSSSAPASAADLAAVLLVYRAAERLARSGDLGSFIDETLDSLLVDLAARSAVLVRRDDVGKLKAVSVRHAEGGKRDDTPVSRSVIDQALRTGRPVQIRDLEGDPSFGSRESVMAHRLGALLAVPLLVGGKAEGALCLSRRGGQAFDDGETEALAGVAGLLGRALSLRDLEKRGQDERSRRKLLERFHAPEVVEQLYEHGGQRGLTEQVVTALHLELTHFERFLERQGASRAAELAEAFRSRVHGAVFQNGGTLIWLHEDSGLAVFGGQGTAESDAAWALTAASEMLRDFVTLGREFDLPQKIALRLGLDRGTVLRGLIGPPDRLQVTAVGAPVIRARDAARAGVANAIHATQSVLAQVPNPRGQVVELGPETTGLEEPLFEITL